MHKEFSWKVGQILQQVICVLIFIVGMNLLIGLYIGWTNDQLTPNLTEMMAYFQEKLVVSPFVPPADADDSDFIQQTPYTSGPATLRYLLYSRYKLDLTEVEIATQVGTSRGGSTLAGMIQMLEGSGLRGIRSQVTYARLKELSMPVIAYINNYHYIVILQVEDEEVYAFDPGPNYGHMKATKENFLKIWNGTVLEVTPRSCRS